MDYMEITINEENIEDAINLLKKSKGKKVLLAVRNLEEDEITIFVSKYKSDCVSIIKEAATIASVCDGFVKQLRTFTEKQKDLLNIEPHGMQKTILLKT